MLGLQKIVLHNSYFKGKTVAIPCNGHTNNSGGNGAGKSSALNLIPIFYGEAPETVNDRAGGKFSFLDYYLPTKTSLITFEYRREDGLRCAVMYRHPSGKVAYRFVNSDFQSAFFEPDLKARLLAGLQVSEVINELKVRKISVSRQITCIHEYRSIIQQNDKGVRKFSRTNKNIRAEVKEFCLGGPNGKMIHMDRLTFSVLKRNSMFKRLKNMIVDTMFGEINIEEKPNHDRNQFLIEEIRSVRKFSDNEKEIKNCVKQSNERMAVHSDIGKYARNLSILIEEKIQHISQKENNQKSLIETFQKKNTDYQLEYQNKEEELQSVDSKRKSKSIRIDNIWKKKDEWDNERKIQDKVLLFENLDIYIDQLNSSEAHYKSILEKVENIELERKTRESEIERLYQYEKDSLTKKISDLEKTKLVKELEHKDEVSDIKNRKLVSLDKEKSSYSSEAEDLRSQIYKKSALKDRVSETDEEKAKIESIQNSMDETQDTINRLEHDIKKRNIEISKIKESLENILTQISFKNKQLNSHHIECDSIKNRLYPEDNTLLSELKEQDPDWGITIGKIINPALLQSKSLSPTFERGENLSAYGWSLDLSKLDIPSSAENEEILIERLRREEAKCAACKTEILGLELSADKTRKEIKSLDDKNSEISFNKRQKETDLEALRINREKARNEIKQSVFERKSAAEKEVDNLSKILISKNQDHDLKIEKISNTYFELEKDAMGRYAAISSEIELDIKSKESLLCEAELSKSSKMEKLNIIFSEKYQQEGVEESYIREAKSDLNRLNEKVNNIKRSAGEISLYEAWKDQEWNSLKELEEEEKELSSSFDNISESLKRLRENFKENMKLHNQELASIEKYIRESKIDVEESKSILKPIKYIQVGEKYNSSDMSFVRIKLLKLIEEETLLKNKILISVNEARRIITYSPESQIAKTWFQMEEMRARTSGLYPHDPAFILQQPADLETLIDNNLPQIRKALVETVINIGGGINNYYLTLKQLSSHVSKVSSELGRKINTEQKIDNLKDIKILLTSRIEEEECWVSLIRFSNEWAAWNSNRDYKLPPESLMSALKDALDTLSVARITSDIGSLIDLNLSMTENNRHVLIRCDSDFDRASSNGLSYLAICVVFLGMSRYLCPDVSIKLTWPIDELAALSPKNIAKLFEMLDNANIAIFSAFPSQDINLLKFFENKNLLDLNRGVRTIKINQKLDKDILKDKILNLSKGEVK